MKESESLVRQAMEGTVGGRIAATRQTRLPDAGVTSLLLFDFVSRLEKLAGVEIPDDDLRPENFTSVGDVADLVDRLQDVEDQA